jgi:hypothetical protein
MEIKIFIWEENNICYRNNNKIYKNVILNTGTIIKGQFENQICTTTIDGNIKIISDSNYYLDGYHWPESYNNQYKIYDNIIRNYQQNINLNTIFEYKYENIKCFYFINPFMFSNSGHDLSTIFNYINYIKNNNIKTIIIIKEYTKTNNFKLVKDILPNDIEIIELLPETIYKFNEIIIIEQIILNIFYHTYLIDDLKNIIRNKYSEKYYDYKNKNIILMKTNRNKNVMLQHTVINCENFLIKLEKLNYIYIIPEDIDIFYLSLLLMYANKIIFSTGSIFYTNNIFFNKDAQLYYITPHINHDCYIHHILSGKFKYILIKKSNIEDDEIDEYINLINT